MNIPPEFWVDRWPYVSIDQIKYIQNMNVVTLDMLNILCKKASERNGWRHIINSDYREGKSGQHPEGRALDIVFYRHEPGDVDVLTQFIFALRSNFSGIGLYPYWKTPGIHID